MDNIQQLGIKEDEYDDEFRQRKNPKTDLRSCSNKNYEWGEYKSSLLVQYILNNLAIETLLNNFVYNYMQKFYDIFKSDNFIDDFTVFLENAQDSGSIVGGKYYANKYGVGQTQIIGHGDQTKEILLKDPTKLNNIVMFSSFIAHQLYFGNKKSIFAITVTPVNILENIRGVNKRLNDKYKDASKGEDEFFNIINMLMILQILQQQTMNAQLGIKGQRINRTIDRPDVVKTTQVGISQIYEEDQDIPEFKDTEFEHGLRRTIKDLDQYIVAWPHPGVEQCKCPYTGNWGDHLKENLEQDRLIASVQCGLSGSILFNLYSYLFSYTTSFPKNPMEDFENLILMSIVTLVGDGGHNIMEVVYGYVFSIIILYNILITLENELQQWYGNSDSLSNNVEKFMKETNESIYNEIQSYTILSILYNNIQVNEGYYQTYFVNCETATIFWGTDKLFKRFLKNWVYWEKFIREAYGRTSDINLTGVTEETLEAYDPDLIIDWRKNYERIDLVHVFLTQRKMSSPFQMNISDPEYNDYIQIALAMDNDRYIGGKTNWEEAATKLVTDILEKYTDGQKGLDMITKELTRKMAKCNYTTYSPQEIPFAFPAPRKK